MEQYFVEMNKSLDTMNQGLETMGKSLIAIEKAIDDQNKILNELLNSLINSNKKDYNYANAKTQKGRR